jgi:hypothetical protein
MVVVAQGAASGRPTTRARGAAPQRTRTRALSLSALLSLALVAFASPALAAVTEPDGMQVPQPLTEDTTPEVVDCCGVMADGSNMSLEALFGYYGENIDWLNDASTTPSNFSPLCGFRGSLILRGGGCRIDFGWYNVDLTTEAPPADSEIYPLVTVADVNAWFTANDYPPNDDNAFHPAVGERPIEGALIENIRNDSRYLGGLIGLATKGNDSKGVCTQTHYSEPRLNQKSVYNNEPWIMAVVWMSTVTANAFYIGFEDLPTAPDNFRLETPQEYQNDGDFNDFVYLVVGITCEDGGQPCLTGAEGACGFGISECLPDGTVVCVSQVTPTGEVCDNLDNDCNGLVDDGDLCSIGEVCDKGVCKPLCSATEFPCMTPLVCDPKTGLCIDPDCLDVECPAGQVCLGGVCLGGCEGAVCPQGQVCQLGRCFDPCASRQPGMANACAEGMVCQGGACVESCHCRLCEPGTECDFDTGACVPAGCVNVACPEGQVCQAGACVDACNNVICPGGATCENGFCGDPLPGYVPQDLSGTGAASSLEPGTGGQLLHTGTGGSSNASSSGADASAAAPAPAPGCGCRTARTGRLLAIPSLILVALALRGLRRRRRR